MAGRDIHSSILTNWSRSPAVWPLVTILIAALCLLLTVSYTLSGEAAQSRLLFFLGYVPAAVAEKLTQPMTAWPGHTLTTLFTSLLLHVSWLHLVGNMAYLWVFGMPVERRMGHAFLLLLFLVGGAIANLSVAMGLSTMATPVIGASGGVSVIVGAYLGLFPARRIGLYLPLGMYLQFARVPALLVIGSWFVLQLLYTAFGPITGAVAWWTHVVGFGVGILCALLARLTMRMRW